MGTQLLLAKPVAEAILSEVRLRTSRFIHSVGRPPKLSVVLVGADPASVIYTARKGEAATRLGMAHETISFPATSTPQEVFSKLRELNADPSVDGILVQRPL